MPQQIYMIKAPNGSVIVPAFNEPGAILKVGLTSIMIQTFRDFECTVVDESGQPELARLCESIYPRDAQFRDQHLAQGLRLPGGLNLTISMARGELLARFDSDNVCFPERQAIKVGFMDDNPDDGVVGSRLEFIDEKGFPTAVRQYPQSVAVIARKLQFTTALAYSTGVYRASAPKSTKAYNPYFRYSEDLNLSLCRLKKGIIFSNLPDVLLKYRQTHPKRHLNHWKFNLRARVRNFAPNFIFWRLAGIACAGTWSAPSHLSKRRPSVFSFLKFVNEQ